MASSTLGLTLNRAPFPLIKEVLTEESTFVEIIVKVQVISVKVTTSSGKSIP
jgi:hypothetical protein